jgi:hypothetical protein
MVVLGVQEIWFSTLLVVCGSFYLGKSMYTADLSYMLPTQDKTVQR